MSVGRRLHIIGNWKMNGSQQQVEAYFAALRSAEAHLPSCDMVICPPFVYLAQTAKLLENSYIKLGAQDVSAYEAGAYTGQIAASMLVEHQCRYVIVGHSERRQLCHETDAEIADKFFAAKAAGLIPILCVGETQSQREQQQTEAIVVGQLQAILQRQGAKAFQGSILAYEPIWAIGTGLTATPEQAQSVHYLLRQTLAEYDAAVAQQLPILYGGSVKPSNVKTLFAMADIDGALVGGASLQAADFLAIAQATQETLAVKGE